jgi:membrane-associated phospholipid phosphatase
MMSLQNSKPSELRRLGLWFIAVMGLTLPFILIWDKPLAWYFEKTLNRDIHAAMGTVTEAANSGIWFGLAAIGVAISLFFAKRAQKTPNDVARHQRHARSWSFMIASMAVAAALVNILKLATGRYRPRYLFNDDLFGFEPFGVALKMASFPSGHAQSIWSAMIALSFLTPRYTAAYIAIALTISASRFLTAVHFVSDVIMAGFLSVVVAVLMRRWFERHGQNVSLD